MKVLIDGVAEITGTYIGEEQFDFITDRNRTYKLFAVEQFWRRGKLKFMVTLIPLFDLERFCLSFNEQKSACVSVARSVSSLFSSV